MKLFVTGVGGQLGHDVMNEASKRGIEAVGSDIAENYSGVADGSPVTTMPYMALDITDAEAVERVIKESGCDAVVHCAAYTAVDAAEDNVDLCRKINSYGTENIAKVCRELDIPMMYFSTDYVFDGEGERPWEPDDTRNPLNVYGQTKYEGELAVEENLEKYFILRIAWVFGKNGKNFIKSMLNLAKTQSDLKVVNDQIGTPTYTYDLARLIVDMIGTDKYGIYHVTNEGYCSWYEFALEIFRQAGVEVNVAPCATEEFPVKAKRPHNSRMNRSKIKEAGFEPLPTWQDALGRYLKEIEV